MSLSKINGDILFYIVQFIPVIQVIVNLSRVNKNLNELLKSNNACKLLCKIVLKEDFDPRLTQGKISPKYLLK